MKQNEALEVLVKSALLAQSKGIFTLDDAVIVKQAIDTFKQPVDEMGKVEPEDNERSEE